MPGEILDLTNIKVLVDESYGKVRKDVDGSHFKRWIKLFYETIDENLRREKPIEAQWRVEKMAEMFDIKHRI